MWRVNIIRRRSNAAGQTVEQERQFVVKHVIFCTGFGSPNPPIPSYPGSDTFKGKMLHSTGYKRATDYQGKKVVIVGACTSGSHFLSFGFDNLFMLHQGTISPWIVIITELVRLS
jgi:cation diffusion facilitator CzcD-associated flavoprotein CzcO